MWAIFLGARKAKKTNHPIVPPKGKTALLTHLRQGLQDCEEGKSKLLQAAKFVAAAEVISSTYKL